MLFKKIIPLIIAACLFGSCSYFSTDDSDDDIPAVVIPTAVAGTSSNAVSLRIKFDGEDARSALPQVDENSFIYIGLRCHFDENNSKMIAEWNSAAEMRNSTITFQTGRYTFDLIAMNTSVTMFDSQTAEIRNGENSLSFTPKLELIDYSFSGKGSLNVKVSFDATNVATVTAGLYYLDGEQCPGYNDVQREIEGGGVCTYSGSEIPAGNYIVIFKFYADEGMTQLLGTYREYASIAGGMTSSSECQISSLASLYKIEYDLGGGYFAGGYTAPGSYTRRTSAITLPKNDNIIRSEDWQFGGWYDNPNFTGEAITEIPSGSTGNRKFYAKWLEVVTITFDLDGKGSMDESKKFLKTLKGVPVLITPYKTLGIVNPSDAFFHGWSKVSKNSGLQTVNYDDWDAITVNENTVLYAVWAVTEINPSEGNPQDKTDSDGDGLTDYEEVFVSHTDPSCADTDGDGWTDKEETSLYNPETKTFSPLIADTPDLKIIIAGDPSISYKYSIGTGTNETENESISNGKTGSSSSSKSSTTTYSVTNQWKEEFGFSKVWGNKAGFEFRFSETYGQGFTSGDSYTYSSSQSEGWSKSWSNGKSKSETHSKTLSAATIKVPIKLKNPSPISYSVKNVTISISRLAHNGPRSTLLPLVTIQKSDVGTLAPNSESIVYTIEAELPNTDVGKQLENLLKYSNGLKVEIAGYSITMFKSGVAGANDFTQALTKVRAKTASVYIDCGRDSGRTPKHYNVSVKNLYNHDATSLETLYKRVTLKDIFDNILKLPQGSASGYELTDTGYIKSIYGVSNNSDLKNGAWYINIKTIESEKKMMYLFSPKTDCYKKLEEIYVNPGDAISIIYDVDMDEDGLLRNEELLHGTRDDNNDSDGDGLNDFEEIYGWYKSSIGLVSKYSDSETSKKVFTNPCLKDTDGDGDVDYTGAGGTQDTDPMIAKYNTNTALKSGKYSVDGGKNFNSFDVKVTKDKNKSPFDNSVDCHTLRLDIEPELPIAHLQVQVTDLEDEPDSNKWIDLKQDTDIGILIGKSIINVRCRVPDGPNSFAEKIHKYIVKSNFTTLKNFQVVPKIAGETAITWDKYVDIRAESKNVAVTSSGYFLQVINTDKASDEEPSYADAVNAQDKPDTKLTKFFMKLSPEKMLKGTCALNLSARTNYLVRLYAFTGDFTPPLGENSHASIKMLAQKRFLSGKSRTAKLAFWAHYIYDNHDHDGDFVDSRYYWSFDCSENYIDFSKLNLSADQTQDMDEDDDQYWVFGNVNGPRDKSYGAQPFGNTSTKLEGSFSRDSNYKFTVRFRGYERDTTNSDHLGTIRADFEYKKNEDRWYCTWWLDSYGDDSACLGFLPKSSQVGCGERVDKNWWELYNVNKGEIAFAWGWDWDYN